MKLIYVQTRVKGPGSPELALEMEIIKIEILQNFYASGTDMHECFMDDFGLDRYKICWRLRLRKYFISSEISGHL